MLNTINTGSLQGLQVNQTLLVSARKVKGQKVQLEFAEIVEKPSAENDPAPAINLVALLNASDTRFSVGNKARRAWMTVEPSDASKHLGIDLTDSNEDWYVNQLNQEVLDLNVLNPVISINGKNVRFRVQIVETTSATEYQKDNISTEAKRKGKDGEFITCGGFYIFTNATVVLAQPNHVFLKADNVGTSAKTTSGIPAVSSMEVDDSPFS